MSSRTLLARATPLRAGDVLAGRARVLESEGADVTAGFRQAAESELKKTEQKVEYQRHRADIETELKRLAGLSQ